MGHRISVVVLPQVFVKHVSNDDLERYVIRAFPASEFARPEEHLLDCPECRERLDAEIKFVRAIRAALRILESRKV